MSAPLLSDEEHAALLSHVEHALGMVLSGQWEQAGARHGAVVVRIQLDSDYEACE